MTVTVTDQPSAIAALTEAGKDIAAALAWYEANSTGATLAEIKAHHALLSVIASRGEAIAGVSAGTFNVQPADGGPKGGD